MQEKGNVLYSIVGSRFPPLADSLKNYTEACDNAVKCASGLECFKKHSDKEIMESVCDNFGTNYYMFEHQCFIPFMRDVFKEEYNCLSEYQLMVKNFSTHNIFDKKDSCVVTLFQENCGPGYVKFFRANYIEIMEQYTSKPEDNSCDSPSDRFEKMACDGLGVALQSKLTQILVLNTSDSDVQTVMETCREAKKCHKNSCTWSLVKNTIEETCDNIDGISGNLTRILKNHPGFAECKCLQKTSYLKWLQLLRQCTWGDKTKDCWLSVIKDSCAEKEIDEFESPKRRVECPKDVRMYGFGNEMFFEEPPRIFLSMRMNN